MTKQIEWNGDLPSCDIHKLHEGVEVLAPYDTPTIFGPWANCCEKCFATYGSNPAMATVRIKGVPAS